MILTRKRRMTIIIGGQSIGLRKEKEEEIEEEEEDAEEEEAEETGLFRGQG